MINILLTSSDAYYPFLQVTLYSLLKHNPDEKFEFYILSDKISPEHMEMIKEKENDNVSINFIEISDIPDKFDLTDIQRNYLRNSPLPITSRLFLSKLLPDTVDKILSLDSDVIVVDSIRELWDVDVTNYYCAGVKDLMPEAFTKSIGLTREHNYLNTGILLLNLKKIREDEKDKEFLDFISDYHDLYMHYDQGIINAVCKDATLLIPPKFNYEGSLHVKNPKNVVKWYVNPEDYYEESIIDEAETNTVIYHFCESSIGRPWTNKNHKYYSLYHQYVLEAGIEEEEIYDFSNEKPFISKLYTLFQTNTTLNSTVNLLPAPITRKITNILISKRIHAKE